MISIWLQYQHRAVLKPTYQTVSMFSNALTGLTELKLTREGPQLEGEGEGEGEGGCMSVIVDESKEIHTPPSPSPSFIHNYKLK
jgi:hypothetical protein